MCTEVLTPPTRTLYQLRDGRRWVFIDFEFIEHPAGKNTAPTIDFVSVGAVDVDDPADHYYAVADDLDLDSLLDPVRNDGWLRDNVAPHLPWKPADDGNTALTPDRFDYQHPTVRPRQRICEELTRFLFRGPPVRMWADCGGYDYVVLSWLWGGMRGHPPGLDYYLNDVNQHLWTHAVDNTTDGYPQRGPAEHHALADAQHGAAVLRFVDRVRLFRAGITTRPLGSRHEPGE